jgi:uncharacterized protein (TIGR00299 family) protein
VTTHLHLDLVGGIAGDMTVAALLDAGVELAELQRLLEQSGLPVMPLVVTRARRGGLDGTHVRVPEEIDAPVRHWSDIRRMLEDAQLPEGARRRALDVFGRLALAEASAHGCAPEQVHFHEVGAMDSIVDVVASSLALELLDVSSASCGRVPVCSGTVQTAHGVLPLPAPATARLLEGFELQTIPGDLETVTPTGAAILASLCGDAGDRSLPAMTLRQTGLGLGTAGLADRPNALRVLVGDRSPLAEPPSASEAVVLEASLDDMDPRLYAEVSRQLFEAGALDVSLMAMQMKKGRPGTLLKVVCRPELEGVLTGIVLRETTTLGVRSHDVRRVVLDRRHREVHTRFGPLRLKCGFLGDELLNVSPEYEDCLALARAQGAPLKEVFAAAQAAADELIRSSGGVG